jgi:hypothetical protein
MLHSSFAPYLSQQQVFSRVIKLLFAAAGCYWIVIYGFQVLGWIDHHTLKTLRDGQTMIYFVLLTLWGMEYMRETKRLKKIISVADASGSRVQDLALSEVLSNGTALTILWPLGSGPAALMYTLINIGGLVLAATLICMRYIAAFKSI